MPLKRGIGGERGLKWARSRPASYLHKIWLLYHYVYVENSRQRQFWEHISKPFSMFTVRLNDIRMSAMRIARGETQRVGKWTKCLVSNILCCLNTSYVKGQQLSNWKLSRMKWYKRKQHLQIPTASYKIRCKGMRIVIDLMLHWRESKWPGPDRGKWLYKTYSIILQLLLKLLGKDSLTYMWPHWANQLVDIQLQIEKSCCEEFQSHHNFLKSKGHNSHGYFKFESVSGSDKLVHHMWID